MDGVEIMRIAQRKRQHVHDIDGLLHLIGNRLKRRGAGWFVCPPLLLPAPGQAI